MHDLFNITCDQLLPFVPFSWNLQPTGYVFLTCNSFFYKYESHPFYGFKTLFSSSPFVKGSTRFLLIRILSTLTIPVGEKFSNGTVRITCRNTNYYDILGKTMESKYEINDQNT